MRMLPVIGLAVVALAHVAAAQSPSPSSGVAVPAREAPVGHRQPRAKDIASDPGTPSEEAAKRFDRELNRKLKGICRGC